MGRRQRLISKSILSAIFRSSDKPSNRPHTIFARLFAFFSIFYLALSRHKAELFKKLRNEIWGIDEDEYRESFRSASKRESLVAVGSLGYSGSVSLLPHSAFSRLLAVQEFIQGISTLSLLLRGLYPSRFTTDFTLDLLHNS